MGKAAALELDIEDMGRQLTQLWDDIHQRQQVLEDIDTSLQGREERLNVKEHSLLCEREARATPGGCVAAEAEQLQLELMAAELAERAWRERSASLAKREEE